MDSSEVKRNTVLLQTQRTKEVTLNLLAILGENFGKALTSRKDSVPQKEPCDVLDEISANLGTIEESIVDCHEVVLSRIIQRLK